MDYSPRSRRAFLPCRLKSALDREIHSLVQVGVRKHDNCVLSAHLKLILLAVRGRPPGDGLSCADRSRERDSGRLWMGDQRLPDPAALAEENVEYSGRQPRLLKALG